MSYDLYAAYPCRTEDDVRRIVGDHRQAPYSELKDVYTRIQLLAPAVVEECKEYAKSGHPRHGGGYQSLVFNGRGANAYTQGLIRPALTRMERMGLYPPEMDLDALPYLSFFLQIHFTMATPCCVGGTETFYVHESPQMKDPVFKVPMLAGSGWKGIFRSVARVLVEGREDVSVYRRLFGSEREETAETGVSALARLRFYPTFFDRIGLDLINPHSRRTKAGTVPIPEEIVLPGARGVLSLLYVPWDLFVGTGFSKARTEAAEDLSFVCDVVNEVLHMYGFSAKASRGFGLARPKYTKPGEGDREMPGGFLEMAGVPVYQGTEGASESVSGTEGEDWRARLLGAREQLSGEEGASEERDNTFSDGRGLERIVKKIVHVLHGGAPNTQPC